MFGVSGRGSRRKMFTTNHQHTVQATDALNDEAHPLHVRVVILGTGFAGLGMAIRLKQEGCDDFVVLERAADIGGTWRDNTYPGCACDIPSHLYSFSFALNPHWSRTFSPQGEIQAYLRSCAQDFGILPHIRWNSELQDAAWNENDQCWHITTAQGQIIANMLIMGNGPLSEPSLPRIPGIENFAGVLFHSAQWKHDYDLTDKRVAVIGTGASAVQFVPKIQPQVAQLFLFQRTPPWILPRQDRPIPVEQQNKFRHYPLIQHFVRTRIYWRLELTALGLVYRPTMLEQGMQIAREHLARQISDPTLRTKLAPQYIMGCKRILLSDDFYPAITQPNVDVITERIREVRANSIVTEDGSEYEIDTIICGTGFHVTDAVLPQHICGRNGLSLADKWQEGPHAYYGTTVAGFPNLFLLIGPNTGLGHNSMVFMIEAQIAYILDGLRKMGRRGIQAIEIQPEAEETFNATLQKRMQGTVWTSGCASWYLDAHGRNTTLWPGFTFEFWRKTRHFDMQHYNVTHQWASAKVERVGIPDRVR